MLILLNPCYVKECLFLARQSIVGWDSLLTVVMGTARGKQPRDRVSASWHSRALHCRLQLGWGKPDIGNFVIGLTGAPTISMYYDDL